jgi:hypothetical protein
MSVLKVLYMILLIEQKDNPDKYVKTKKHKSARFKPNLTYELDATNHS